MKYIVMEDNKKIKNVKIGDIFIAKDGDVYSLIILDSKLLLLNMRTNTIYSTYETYEEIENGSMENNYFTHYSQDEYELNLVRKK